MKSVNKIKIQQLDRAVFVHKASETLLWTFSIAYTVYHVGMIILNAL